VSKFLSNLFLRFYNSLINNTTYSFNLHATLIIGTVIRLLLMPFIAHPYDVYAWYMICIDILTNGFNYQSLDLMRPFWSITLAFVAFFYKFFSNIFMCPATSIDSLPDYYNPHYDILWVPGPLFNFLVKMPMLLADIGTTIILYYLIKKFSKNILPEKAIFIFYLNPVSIWISSGWGQYDVIPVFFTVFSLYLLLDNHITFSAISLLSATLFKIYPAIFIVPILFYLYKTNKRGKFLNYLFVFILPYFIYLFLNGINSIHNFLNIFFSYFFPSGAFHGIFGFGLTYWSWSLLLPLEPNIWVPISVLLMIIFLIVSLFYISHIDFINPLKELTISLFIISAPFFLASNFVSEVRFIWLLPLFILMIIDGLLPTKLVYLISCASLLYMQKNFPYYLLPLVTINEEILSSLFNMALMFGYVTNDALLPNSYGALILASLGTIFSFLLLTLYFKILSCIKLRKPIDKLIKTFFEGLNY